MKCRIGFFLSFVLFYGSAIAADHVSFPTQRPEGACYPRPRQNETLDISPPGFCWWPAGKRGKVNYRLRVMNDSGTVVYESKAIDDPVHVPTRVLPAGRYTWVVDALDKDGKVLDVRAPDTFAITDGAITQPWVPAEELLARVPHEHPRLLFPKTALESIRTTLGSTRKEAFDSLKHAADGLLKTRPPEEPDYDKMKDPAARRIAYQETFGKMRKYHDNAMVNLALMYVLTGEKKYGECAKAILLETAKWNPEGISSVLAPYGDEVGLGIARSAAQAYDWLYDLMSDDERTQVKKMLIARGDQMLRRLMKHDFLARPEESHAGRLVGYLIEHAIAVAEEPQARVWLDYALRTALTVFPHWAGGDGGWAEGISYGLAYNTIYLTPLETLRVATGFDLWQRPFYRKIRYFFLYNISPLGEVAPHGDGEDSDIPGRASGIRALLKFHSLRYKDSSVRGWIDLLQTRDGKPAEVSPLAGIILPDDVSPKPPVDLPPDAVFYGIGWAALHTDLAHPDRDLMVMFKSSPYGAVSHSHADQNTFVIMKGGKVLAMPAGAYYPTYGAPFHVKYSRQTLSHNGILVNNQGQIVREGKSNGKIVAFESKPHLGYVCGDATAAYGKSMNGFRRHVLMVRPSVVVVVDDLETPEPAEFQWLLHAKDRLELDELAQTLVSRRGGAVMKVYLVTADGFGFTQTDTWPLLPKEGYPTTNRPEPARQWHFTAATKEKTAKKRIAAVMFIDGEGDVQKSENMVEVTVKLPDGETKVRINLKNETTPLINAQYQPKQGEAEMLSVK